MRRFLVSLLLVIPALTRSADVPVLELAKTIPLPNVEGRIDHLAYDAKGKRLFVAALGNNTLEVIDLDKGERVHSIAKLDEPQGIAYIAGRNQIAVANGGDGSCRIYDGTTYALVKSIDLKSDADNVRYDAANKRIFAGFGNGAMAFIDAATQNLTGEVKLSAHPESFQLEKNGPRIFVNVPHSKQIEVIDRDKKSVVASWPLTMAQSNFAMAMDESNNRLFAGCRAPSKVVVMDMTNGREITSFPCVGDTDDIFFDSSSKLLYVIGGEGKIQAFSQTDADNYKLEKSVVTRPGARTGLYAAETGMLFVAAPHKTEGAAILCYRTK